MRRLVLIAIAAALLTALPRSAGRGWAEVGGEFAELERHVAQHPGDREARQRLAEDYAAAGFIEEAVAEYLFVLTVDRGDEQARTRIGVLVRERIPDWLPAEAAEVAPFPQVTFRLSLPDATMKERMISCRVLRTTGASAAREGERLDPAHGWAFPVVDYGYVWSASASRWVMKVRAHRGSQVDEALADSALTASLCFHCVVGEYLRRDPTQPDGEPVDLWLGAEGEPGARSVGRSIYLYAVGVPRTPTEWLREIAHEYGHISLPGIGGFTETDDPWADGELGELLFIKWLAASWQPPGLAWSVKEAERTARPRREELISRARGKPDPARLTGADVRARDYFLGLALRVEEMAGPRFLGEALARCPRGKAADFVAAAEGLAKEQAVKVWAEEERFR